MNPSGGTVLIRGARQLLTLRGHREPRRGANLGELGVICDGSVLIRNGVLEEVGPTRRVENLSLARDAREIDASGRVVMPGLVDPHTHLLYPFSLSAGTEDGADPDFGSIHQVSGKRLEVRARGYVDAMVRHGTTTFEAKTGCGLDEAAESKVLRVLAGLDGSPLDVVPTFLARFGEALEEGGPEVPGSFGWVCGDLMAKVRKRRMASFADVDWPGGKMGPEGARRFIQAARETGFAVKVHDETEGGESGVRLAVESCAASIDHVTSLREDELGMLAASGTIATLLPTTAFHGGGRQSATGRALVNAGVAVALGSNFNPMLTPTLSMQTVISLACLQLRLTPEEAIAAATINAAHALRLAGRVGSLELGKSADLLILDTADYRDLAHYLGQNLVAVTIKRGETIYSQGMVERRENPGLTRVPA